MEQEPQSLLEQVAKFFSRRRGYGFGNPRNTVGGFHKINIDAKNQHD